MKTRAEAWALLTRYTKNPNLQKHALAVEAAMRHYAQQFGGDEEVWGMAGLLHDFDYEQYPSLENHPYKGQEILQAEGYPEEIRQIIMAHAPHTGTPRVSVADKAIFASDELTGLIVAVALLRPNKTLAEVTVEHVKKKMKEKRFAAGVDRSHIIQGSEELGLSVDEHIQHVLSAMQGSAASLGL